MSRSNEQVGLWHGHRQVAGEAGVACRAVPPSRPYALARSRSCTQWPKPVEVDGCSFIGGIVKTDGLRLAASKAMDLRRVCAVKAECMRT